MDKREGAARSVFPGRVGLQQRVLPAYRAPLFDRLALACQNGLGVFAGSPQAQEAIRTTDRLETARLTIGRNRHFLSVDSPLYLCWQAGLVAWLEAWKPDVLIVEANPRNRTTAKAVDWMHTRHRPVIGWGLGAPPITGLATRWRSAARARFLQRFDALIAYSQQGAAEFRSAGIPTERVHIALNAVVPRPDHPPPQRGVEFDGRPRLLFVGRLQARKRIDLLLRACADLPEEQQPELTIIGDGPARAHYETLAEKLLPTTSFTGPLYGPHLERYFAAADLFVLPGTGGLAIQEAMAHGLPVIAAQGDGTQADLVRHANGWTVTPGDLGALSQALANALADPKRLRRMGAESYRIVLEEANLEVMTEAFVGALNQVSGR